MTNIDQIRSELDAKKVEQLPQYFEEIENLLSQTDLSELNLEIKKRVYDKLHADYQKFKFEDEFLQARANAYIQQEKTFNYTGKWWKDAGKNKIYYFDGLDFVTADPKKFERKGTREKREALKSKEIELHKELQSINDLMFGTPDGKPGLKQILEANDNTIIDVAKDIGRMDIGISLIPFIGPTLGITNSATKYIKKGANYEKLIKELVWKIDSKLLDFYVKYGQDIHYSNNNKGWWYSINQSYLQTISWVGVINNSVTEIMKHELEKDGASKPWQKHLPYAQKLLYSQNKPVNLNWVIAVNKPSSKEGEIFGTVDALLDDLAHQHLDADNARNGQFTLQYAKQYFINRHIQIYNKIKNDPSLTEQQKKEKIIRLVSIITGRTQYYDNRKKWKGNFEASWNTSQAIDDDLVDRENAMTRLNEAMVQGGTYELIEKAKWMEIKSPEFNDNDKKFGIDTGYKSKNEMLYQRVQTPYVQNVLGLWQAWSDPAMFPNPDETPRSSMSIQQKTNYQLLDSIQKIYIERTLLSPQRQECNGNIETFAQKLASDPALQESNWLLLEIAKTEAYGTINNDFQKQIEDALSGGVRGTWSSDIVWRKSAEDKAIFDLYQSITGSWMGLSDENAATARMLWKTVIILGTTIGATIVTWWLAWPWLAWLFVTALTWSITAATADMIVNQTWYGTVKDAIIDRWTEIALGTATGLLGWALMQRFWNVATSRNPKSLWASKNMMLWLFDYWTWMFTELGRQRFLGYNPDVSMEDMFLNPIALLGLVMAIHGAKSLSKNEYDNLVRNINTMKRVVAADPAKGEMDIFYTDFMGRKKSIKVKELLDWLQTDQPMKLRDVNKIKAWSTAYKEWEWTDNLTPEQRGTKAEEVINSARKAKNKNAETITLTEDQKSMIHTIHNLSKDQLQRIADVYKKANNKLSVENKAAIEKILQEEPTGDKPYFGEHTADELKTKTRLGVDFANLETGDAGTLVRQGLLANKKPERQRDPAITNNEAVNQKRITDSEQLIQEIEIALRSDTLNLQKLTVNEKGKVISKAKLNNIKKKFNEMEWKIKEARKHQEKLKNFIDELQRQITNKRSTIRQQNQDAVQKEIDALELRRRARQEEYNKLDDTLDKTELTINKQKKVLTEQIIVTYLQEVKNILSTRMLKKLHFQERLWSILLEDGWKISSLDYTATLALREQYNGLLKNLQVLKDKYKYFLDGQSNQPNVGVKVLEEKIAQINKIRSDIEAHLNTLSASTTVRDAEMAKISPYTQRTSALENRLNNLIQWNRQRQTPWGELEFIDPLHTDFGTADPIRVTDDEIRILEEEFNKAIMDLGKHQDLTTGQKQEINSTIHNLKNTIKELKKKSYDWAYTQLHSRLDEIEWTHTTPPSAPINLTPNDVNQLRIQFEDLKIRKWRIENMSANDNVTFTDLERRYNQTLTRNTADFRTVANEVNVLWARVDRLFTGIEDDLRNRRSNINAVDINNARSDFENIKLRITQEMRNDRAFNDRVNEIESRLKRCEIDVKRTAIFKNLEDFVTELSALNTRLQQFENNPRNSPLNTWEELLKDIERMDGNAKTVKTSLGNEIDNSTTGNRTIRQEFESTDSRNPGHEELIRRMKLRLDTANFQQYTELMDDLNTELNSLNNRAFTDNETINGNTVDAMTYRNELEEQFREIQKRYNEMKWKNRNLTGAEEARFEDFKRRYDALMANNTINLINFRRRFFDSVIVVPGWPTFSMNSIITWATDFHWIQRAEVFLELLKLRILNSNRAIPPINLTPEERNILATQFLDFQGRLNSLRSDFMTTWNRVMHEGFGWRYHNTIRSWGNYEQVINDLVSTWDPIAMDYANALRQQLSIIRFSTKDLEVKAEQLEKTLSWLQTKDPSLTSPEAKSAMREFAASVGWASGWMTKALDAISVFWWRITKILLRPFKQMVGNENVVTPMYTGLGALEWGIRGFWIWWRPWAIIGALTGGSSTRFITGRLFRHPIPEHLITIFWLTLGMWWTQDLGERAVDKTKEKFSLWKYKYINDIMKDPLPNTDLTYKGLFDELEWKKDPISNDELYDDELEDVVDLIDEVNAVNLPETEEKVHKILEDLYKKDQFIKSLDTYDSSFKQHVLEHINKMNEILWVNIDLTNQNAVLDAYAKSYFIENYWLVPKENLPKWVQDAPYTQIYMSDQIKKKIDFEISISWESAKQVYDRIAKDRRWNWFNINTYKSSSSIPQTKTTTSIDQPAENVKTVMENRYKNGEIISGETVNVWSKWKVKGIKTWNTRTFERKKQ